MATENAVMAAVARAGRDGRSATPPASRTSRISAASSSRSAPQIDGHRVERPPHPRRRAAARRRVADRPRAHRGRQLHRPRRGHERRPDDRRRRGRRPASRSSPRSSGSAIDVERRRRRLRVPPDQELVIQDDLGGQIPKIEDGPWPAFPADLTSIAVAVATQAWGTILDLREDVREPPVLRRQARLDGRADHPLRPAPRRRQRPVAALRPADDEPGHPRRHGDAHRRALRRGHVDDRQRRARSTAATSGSTSGSARVGAQIERVEA